MDYEFYDGTHTGQEIDEGIDKALSPDTAPTADSDALITSGAVEQAVTYEATQRTVAIQQAISASNPNKTNSTLVASNWSSGKYSFETQYPFGTYDLTVEVSALATSGQYDAFTAGQIVGSATENAITALGVVPAVDIPIVLTVKSLVV